MSSYTRYLVLTAALIANACLLGGCSGNGGTDLGGSGMMCVYQAEDGTIYDAFCPK